MFKDHPIKSYLIYSILAAVLYCIPAAFFIMYGSFTKSYILYIGNALFGCGIAVFILLYNNKRNENASTGMMVFAGHITTVMGILISCVISLVLLLLASRIFGPGTETSTTFNSAPAQMQVDRTGNFIFSLFMNAIVGNVSAGSFLSIILSYAAKRNQKGDSSTVKIPG